MVSKEDATIKLQRIFRGSKTRKKFINLLDSSRNKIKILEDFIDSETEYVEKLEQLYKFYKDGHDQLSGPIDDAIFGGLPQIYTGTKDFYEYLKSQTPLRFHSFHSFLFGQGLLEMPSLLEGYSIFIDKEPLEHLAVETAKHMNPGFFQAISNKDDEMLNLMKSIYNRPAYYKETINSLLAYSDSTHEDYEALAEIKEKLYSNPLFKTEEQRKNDNISKVTHQHEAFHHKVDIRPYRRLIYEKNMTVEGTPFKAILYNDCLVLKKQENMKTVFFSEAKIESGDIEGKSPIKVRIAGSKKGRSATVTLPDQHECSLWFIAIKGACLLWNENEDSVTSKRRIWKQGNAKIKNKVLNVSTWNPKYLVMRKQELEIYENENDSEPQEILPLEDASLAKAEQKTKRQNTFELRIPNKRATYCEVDNDKEVNSWIKKFEERRFAELEGDRMDTLSTLFENDKITPSRYAEALNTDKAILRQQTLDLQDQLSYYESLDQKYDELKKSNEETEKLNDILRKQIELMRKDSKTKEPPAVKPPSPPKEPPAVKPPPSPPKEPQKEYLFENTIQIIKRFTTIQNNLPELMEWITEWMATFSRELGSLNHNQLLEIKNELEEYFNEKEEKHEIIKQIKEKSGNFGEKLEELSVIDGKFMINLYHMWEKLGSMEEGFIGRLEQLLEANTDDISNDIKLSREWIQDITQRINLFREKDFQDKPVKTIVEEFINEVEDKAQEINELKRRANDASQKDAIIGLLHEIIQLQSLLTTTTVEKIQISQDEAAELWRQTQAKKHRQDIETFLQEAHKILSKPIPIKYPELLKPTLQELRNLRMEWENLSHKMIFIDDEALIEEEFSSRSLLRSKLSQLEYLLKQFYYQESPSLKTFENQVDRINTYMDDDEQGAEEKDGSMDKLINNISEMNSSISGEYESIAKNEENYDNRLQVLLRDNLHKSFNEFGTDGTVDEETMEFFVKHMLKYEINDEELKEITGVSQEFSFAHLMQLMKEKKLWHIVGCNSEAEFVKLMEE